MLQTLYGIIPNIHGKGECAKVCYLENVLTSMFYAAQSLVMLQTLYGIIPNIHGKGECANSMLPRECFDEYVLCCPVSSHSAEIIRHHS